jgi:hypothetical protein
VPKGCRGTRVRPGNWAPVDAAHGAVCGKIAPRSLAKRYDARFTLGSPETEIRHRDVKKKMLYEKLEREAGGGASLSELEADINMEGRLLTVVEREEAWLYAWALRKHQERRRLGSGWEEKQGYGDAGDAGAG